MTDPAPIIRNWLPYIHRKAYAFSRAMVGYLDYEDLISIGMMAAWRAIETYDESRGAALGSHVCYHVVRAFRAEYDKARAPSRGLRAVHYSMHPREEEDWMGIDVADSRPLVSELLALIERDQRTRQALDHLSANERHVIVARYFDEQTFVEMAERMGFSRQRAQQVETEAIGKLRRKLRSSRGAA